MVPGIPRAKLTASDAINIYKLKNTAASAMSVARVFNVGEKTVRDVWKGRTWAKETWHLDTARPLTLKRAGRPAGSKDLKPRKKRRVAYSLPTSESEPGVPDTLQVYPFVRVHSLDQDNDPVTSIDAESSCNHPPNVEEEKLDDFLVELELNAHFTLVDPFAQDWALALQKLK